MKEHSGISRAVRLINSILDNGLVLLLLLGLAYGCYALWDSQNLAQEATAEQYAVYKPQEDTLGFAELQALNEDVIDGKFKGAEGYICRIKKNSRLVVAIQGVCAVATSYIPQSFIQKI